MTVRLTALAKRELSAQLAYLATASTEAARRLAVNVRRALAYLDSGHADGPPIELRTGRRLRRWVVPPLVVYYDRRGPEVVVRRVRHEAQRPITRG